MKTRYFIAVGLGFAVLALGVALFTFGGGSVKSLGETVSTVFERQPADRAVTIKGERFTLEVAATPQAQTKGLSGRESLAPDHGMLFVFAKPGLYPFWMKDTLIPLDIIWIDGQTVQESVTLYPPGEIGMVQKHEPFTPADKVIELPAGTAQRLDIRPGTEIQFGS